MRFLQCRRQNDMAAAKGTLGISRDHWHIVRSLELVSQHLQCPPAKEFLHFLNSSCRTVCTKPTEVPIEEESLPLPGDSPLYSFLSLMQSQCGTCLHVRGWFGSPLHNAYPYLNCRTYKRMFFTFMTSPLKHHWSDDNCRKMFSYAGAENEQ